VKAPTIVGPTGLETKGPAPAGSSWIDEIKNLGMPTLAVAGVGLAGIGFLLLRKPKAKTP
jgi:hypothetical protein